MSLFIHYVILWFILYIPMWLLCTISGKNKVFCICICNTPVESASSITDYETDAILLLESNTQSQQVVESDSTRHASTEMEVNLQKSVTTRHWTYRWQRLVVQRIPFIPSQHQHRKSTPLTQQPETPKNLPKASKKPPIELLPTNYSAQDTNCNTQNEQCSISIGSLNVNGLKRRLLFPDCSELISKYDIMCISETNLTNYDIVDLQGCHYVGKTRKHMSFKRSGGIGVS